MKFNCVRDRVVGKEIKPSKKTKGGLILPESYVENDKTLIAVQVLALGPGIPLPSGAFRTYDFGVGDTVLVSRWLASESEVDGETYRFFSSSEVDAVVEEGDSDEKEVVDDRA